MDIQQYFRKMLALDPTVFDISLLGASGTGKTTLLASMYGQFPVVLNHAELALGAADPDTEATLNRYIANLQALPRELRVPAGVPGVGIPGGAAAKEYKLSLRRNAGGRDLMALRFTDYPGGYITDPQDYHGDEIAVVQRALAGADVVFVAINTSALMEDRGMHHPTVNKPEVIRGQIERLLREETDRLIVLVPVKCEKYMGSREERWRLTRAVEDAYDPLLKIIRYGDAQGRTGCVLTPVQTVGSLIYSTTEQVQDGPGEPTLVFNYRTKTPFARYQPVDTDQPLRYALRFIVNKYRHSGRGWLLDKYQRTFGTDEELTYALRRFTEGCKDDESFRILHGHRFLRAG